MTKIPPLYSAKSLPVIAAGLLAASSLHGANYTWTGGGTNNSWGGAGNFTPTPVTFDNTADLFFNVLTRGTNYLGANRTIRSMTFGADIDSPFVANWQTFANGTALTNTMSADAGNATITVEAGATGNITLGSLSGGTGTFGVLALATNLDVTHNGTGILLFNRSITGAGVNLTKQGGGTMTLSGSHAYTGATTVSGGRLTVFSTSANSLLSTNITINGGTLAQISGGGNVGGLITNAAAWTISSGSYTNNFLGQTMGSLAMSGGSMNLNGANITVTGAAAVTGGGITNDNVNTGNGRVYFDGGLTLGGATFAYRNANNASNSIVRLSNSVTYAAENTAAAWFTNTSTGTGRLELAGSTGGSATNTFDIGDAAAVASEVNIDWRIAGAGIALRKTGNGVLTLGGTDANTYSGSTVVDGGTLVLSKTAGNAVAGNLQIGTGATVLVAASNQVADTSAVTLAGGTIARGSGVSEIFGDLNVTTVSIIDFGGVAESHYLQFGSVTGGSNLTIENFLLDNEFLFAAANFDDGAAIADSFTFTASDTRVYSFAEGTFTVTAVPEPSTFALCAAGLAALLLAGRWRRC